MSTKSQKVLASFLKEGDLRSDKLREQQYLRKGHTALASALNKAGFLVEVPAVDSESSLHFHIKDNGEEGDEFIVSIKPAY